jgi:hypothetical protein
MRKSILTIICLAILLSLLASSGTLSKVPKGEKWKAPKGFKSTSRGWSPPKKFVKPAKPWKAPKGVRTPSKKWEPPKGLKQKFQPWNAPASFIQPKGEIAPAGDAKGTIDKVEPIKPTAADEELKPAPKKEEPKPSQDKPEPAPYKKPSIAPEKKLVPVHEDKLNDPDNKLYP